MTIKEISEQLNISQDTLRYYEKIGLIKKVSRTLGGIRDYQQEQINNINFIKCMRDAGVSIDALVKYLSLFESDVPTEKERKEILIEEREKLRQKLEQIKVAYEKLNYKIEMYESIILEKEKEFLKSNKK